jgi:hypothetical protein
MPTSQGSGHPSTGYVVKVTPAHSPHRPRWIGERNAAGVRWLGNRSDARIFATPEEAKQEIQAFHRMLTGAFSYEIEPI